MSVAVAYPLAVADAAADAAIVAGGVPLAFLALAWYAYSSITHDPHWSNSGGSSDTDTTPNQPPAPAPPPPGRDDPVVGGDAYAGLAHSVRGLVGPATFLGIGRSPVPCAIPEHIMAVPRRAMRERTPRSPIITRSMTRGARLASEAFETPQVRRFVRRTGEGIYRHTSYRFVERNGRQTHTVRAHPYRIAAHMFGFGHLAHLIP